MGAARMASWYLQCLMHSLEDYLTVRSCCPESLCLEVHKSLCRLLGKRMVDINRSLFHLGQRGMPARPKYAPRLGKLLALDLPPH